MQKMISSSHPVRTGGSTNGKWTEALSTGRPGNLYRVNTDAVTSPKLTARAGNAVV